MKALGPLGVGTTQAIEAGSYTELFEIDGMKDFAGSLDQNGLVGAVYVGTDNSQQKLFDGSDNWAVAYESVVGGDINTPAVRFSNSYMSGGTWVSGDKVDFELPLTIYGYTICLPIHGAVVTMQFQGNFPNATAINGIIAGHVAAEDVVDAISSSYGNNPTLNGVLDEVRADSGLMVDGTSSDSTKTCDAISIGLGFDGVNAAASTVAAPRTPSNPCSDAGTN